MSTVDSLLLPIMNSNNSNSIHANSRFQDFNYRHHQHQFLLSPSTSNSIIKNGISAYTNNNNSSTLSSIVPGEEISTIFVVGFPENMQEREFQNMFIFSPGFEAATLKLPPTSLNSSKHDFEDDSNRKQIIGFAKFRTRQEALDAKEVLNGKKIDSDKVLKAEMAKKNLHTKRGLLHEPSTSTTKSLYEAFHSVPINEFSPSTSPTHSYIAASNQQQQQQSQHQSPSYHIHPQQHQQPQHSIFGIMGNQFTTNHSTSIYPAHSSSSLLSSMSPSLQKEDVLASQLLQKLVLSTSLPMPTSSISTNNVDQNPPCNTLYVGNLPANTNEDELRQLFTHCLGYKRCSFRVKSNGPMCFVEFDDLKYAALALKEMQGIPLSNSVKGGIRLSYSKNPLGVRQNMA
ncbi:uncharacterized protein ATC70_007587 [Mucor velutinosus]|uniref:RRM domain-containing protein n=1 Tax=Mucor velutinosus TaxID=708070 RepID=A0AAN7D2A8_9FUNG|nr:hypothetical protein ATC70_007587 [Mucor velutinosus]